MAHSSDEVYLGETPLDPATSPSSRRISSVLATSFSPDLADALMRQDPRYEAARQARLAYQAAAQARGTPPASRKR